MYMLQAYYIEHLDRKASCNSLYISSPSCIVQNDNVCLASESGPGARDSIVLYKMIITIAHCIYLKDNTFLNALEAKFKVNEPQCEKTGFLAHLSRRLTRWAYRMTMIRRPSVRPSSVVHNFKDLLLWNRLADLVEILYGASLGSGISSLIAKSRSHDQDGRHAHIW